MADGATRVTHQVRCRSKTNPQLYVDVEVLDAIVFKQPAGGDWLEFCLTTKVDHVILAPCIIDNTGDGNGKGSPGSCSRLSHMERMTSLDDDTQFIDVEILDGWAVQPPALFTSQEDTPDRAADVDNLGFVDTGDFNAAQHAFVCPFPKAATYVVDKVGLGLQRPFNEFLTTRSGHINMVTNAGDTDLGTQFSDDIEDDIPPTKHPFIATIKLDAISFGEANGNLTTLVIPKPGQDKSQQNTVDNTKYVTDPFTQEPHSPPDNTDPNVYVFIPAGSNGANLGKTPKSEQTGLEGPINQGPFWWIRKISSQPPPWYWYATPQEPLAFSFFGSPPEGTPTKWGYRGFQLLNFFPVIWILSVNNPLLSMGSFGASSLEIAATVGDWSSTGTLPNGSVGIQQGGGVFAPFGVLPMLDPPVPEEEINDSLPNIWQLTGIPQPPLANPMLPWDRVHNPYLFPTSDVAEHAAKLFASNWQAVANGVNALLPSIKGTPFFIGIPPPGWNWAIDYVDAHGPPDPTWDSFQNGILPQLIGGDGTLNLPPEIFVPATVWNLDVDQLDPKVWDTRPSESQELGRSTPPFGPPVTWASEAPPPG